MYLSSPCHPHSTETLRCSRKCSSSLAPAGQSRSHCYSQVWRKALVRNCPHLPTQNPQNTIVSTWHCYHAHAATFRSVRNNSYCFIWKATASVCCIVGRTHGLPWHVPAVPFHA